MNVMFLKIKFYYDKCKYYRVWYDTFKSILDPV